MIDIEPAKEHYRKVLSALGDISNVLEKFEHVGEQRRAAELLDALLKDPLILDLHRNATKLRIALGDLTHQVVRK